MWHRGIIPPRRAISAQPIISDHHTSDIRSRECNLPHPHIFLTTSQACVSSHHFASALPVLSYPITSIDTSLSDLNYNDNLVYHYTGGIALAALKRWREAEEFFEIYVSSPSPVLAAVQMEALKKQAIVWLNSRGKAWKSWAFVPAWR